MSPNRARASSSRHVRQSPCGSDDKHATQEAVVLPVVVSPPRRILSRSSSRPTPHVQTEDYEETLSEYILGQEYDRFFFKTHLFRATARVARSRTTGLNRAARTKHKNYPSCGRCRDQRPISFHCRFDKYFIPKPSCKCRISDNNRTIMRWNISMCKIEILLEYFASNTEMAFYTLSKM